METNSGMIHAFSIDGNGAGSSLSGDDNVAAVIESEQLAWAHFDASDSNSKTWLETKLGFLDSIIVQALLAEETRPRILQFDQGTLLILRGVNLNDDARPEDMVSIRLWVDQYRIITVRRRKLKAIADIKERLIAGKGPKNSGEFVSMLVNRLFGRMEPIFSELDERLDDSEEQVMENPDASLRQEITAIRKQAILFRRYIAPQRDVLAALRTSDQAWLSLTDKRHLQESLDQVIRYVEDIDAIRERAQITKDELANALSDKMNKNLYMLSVVAAIFLPLGFFTGLLGINIGGIPGAEMDNGFLIFCAMLVGVVIFQIGLFRYLKWF